MDFKSINSKQFQINGTLYNIHDFVSKEISLFKAIDDTNSNELHNFIIPNATDEDINKILGALYSDDINQFGKVDVDGVKRILTIMTFMSIDVSIVRKYAKHMIDSNKIKLIEIVGIYEYHDCINIMIDEVKTDYWDNIPKIINNIVVKNSDFPIDFKLKTIVKILSSITSKCNFDIITGITINCNKAFFGKKFDEIASFKHESFENIIKPDSRKNNEFNDLYKRYLDIPVAILIGYDPDSLTISNIKINNKDIPLIDHQKPVTEGMIGGNCMMSMMNHVARVLLKLDSL